MSVQIMPTNDTRFNPQKSAVPVLQFSKHPRDRKLIYPRKIGDDLIPMFILRVQINRSFNLTDQGVKYILIVSKMLGRNAFLALNKLQQIQM